MPRGSHWSPDYPHVKLNAHKRKLKEAFMIVRIYRNVLTSHCTVYKTPAISSFTPLCNGTKFLWSFRQIPSSWRSVVKKRLVLYKKMGSAFLMYIQLEQKQFTTPPHHDPSISLRFKTEKPHQQEFKTWLQRPHAFSQLFACCLNTKSWAFSGYSHRISRYSSVGVVMSYISRQFGP